MSKVEFSGSIMEIRDIEDAIRASKKYTETIGTLFTSLPIQGTEFQSKVLTRNYEVYPDVVVTWDMPAMVAWLGLVCAEAKIIKLKFRYDYRENKAGLRLPDENSLEELKTKIPGFAKAMEKVTSIPELVKPILDGVPVKHETK